MKEKNRQIPAGAGDVNWEERHEKINRVVHRLEQGWKPEAEEKNKILRERAKNLGRSRTATNIETGLLNLLVFTLADESYAMEIRFVREICQLNELVPVPCTPGFILGMIHVRGEIVSVVDLKKIFDLPVKGLTELNKVIIIHNNTMEFGILADTIPGIRSIPSGSLQKSLPTLTGIREEYLLGVTRESLVVLDAGKLLSDKDMIVHDVPLI